MNTADIELTKHGTLASVKDWDEPLFLMKPIVCEKVLPLLSMLHAQNTKPLASSTRYISLAPTSSSTFPLTRSRACFFCLIFKQIGRYTLICMRKSLPNYLLSGVGNYLKIVFFSRNGEWHFHHCRLLLNSQSHVPTVLLTLLLTGLEEEDALCTQSVHTAVMTIQTVCMLDTRCMWTSVLDRHLKRSLPTRAHPRKAIQYSDDLCPDGYSTQKDVRLSLLCEWIGEVCIREGRGGETLMHII